MFFAGYFLYMSAQSCIDSMLEIHIDSFPTRSGWNVCVSPVLMNRIHQTTIPPSSSSSILLCFCGTLIGWGWGNLPPQTCFLPDPGARSVFLTNYRLPSEMICNSSQWITLPSAVCMTCQYPLSFSDISGGYLGGGGSGLTDKLRPSQKNLP